MKNRRSTILLLVFAVCLMFRPVAAQNANSIGEGVRPEARGEQVIVLGPAAPVPTEEPSDDVVEGALRAELADGASTRDAAAAVAHRLGVARKRAYTLATSLRRAARP